MRAISSMATRHLLADLHRSASEAGLPTVELESVGGVAAAQRVADGEPFDLVYLSVGQLRALAEGGSTVAETVTPLVLSQTAVAVPSDSSAPAEYLGGVAFSGAPALRSALKSAGRIGYSTGPSGVALTSMIADWGLGDELRERLVQARPGVPVAKLLADGEVDLGFQQLSELVGQSGVQILGVLPPDCVIDTVFAGAVSSASADPAAAKKVLEFLASDSATPIVLNHSFARP